MNPALARLLASRPLALIAAAVLAAIVFARATEAFPYQFGIDFYQFWGVVVAHRELGPATTPYADPQGYARVLNRIADASGEAKLRNANHFRRAIEPMATPFFYSTFDWVGTDYERAQAAYTALLYAATAIATFVLARLRALAVVPSVALAFLVPLAFNPFIQDVKYGNVSSLQLAYMAALLRVAVRRGWPAGALAESLLVGSLAAFVLFKPTTLWIAAALVAHHAVARGAQRAALAALAGAAIAALALACGAAYFHDVGVWSDWFAFTQGKNGGSLVRSLEQGNLSPAMLLAQRSMSWSLLGYSAMISLWLAAAFAAAMSALGKRPDLVLATARRSLADPWCALSIGILFTFATSPLVWAYYHLFALVPIFWLAVGEGRSRFERGCALVAGVAFLNPLLELLGAAGRDGAIHSLMLLSWMPLLAGAFAAVVREREAAAAGAMRGA